MKNILPIINNSKSPKRFTDYLITSNRNVFNKLHKEFHSHCSYCSWHKKCNFKGNYYGSYGRTASIDTCKRPNWKLVKKNQSQWQDKGLKFEIEEKRKRTNISIIF